MRDLIIVISNKLTLNLISASISAMKCDAKYGAIENVLGELQNYVNDHIEQSMEYLLMSTHYANYEKSRAGFEKFFRELSDDKWNTAIDLIKYITKRGGEMRFVKDENEVEQNGVYELYELEAMAKSLDMEKTLAKKAQDIHSLATKRRDEFHDPEISSHIEEKFSHKQANTIRTISGHVSDLTKLLSDQDSSLSLFFFDQYLQKL